MQHSQAGRAHGGLGGEPQAAVLRAQLALGCCSSAAAAISGAVASGAMPRETVQKRLQHLTQTLAAFLQRIATRPLLPPPSSARCFRQRACLLPLVAPAACVSLLLQHACSLYYSLCTGCSHELSLLTDAVFCSSSTENDCKAALLPTELYASALACAVQACRGLTAPAQLAQDLGSEGSLDSLTALLPCNEALLRSLMRHPVNVVGAQVSRSKMRKAIHLPACGRSQLGCSQSASNFVHLQVKPFMRASCICIRMPCTPMQGNNRQICQRCTNGMTCLQDSMRKLPPAAEALKWEAVAAALEMAAAAPATTPATAAGTMQVALLTETVRALQTADSQSLLPLLQCLRSVNATHHPQAMARVLYPTHA